MNNTRDIAKVRLHDGIVGLLNIGSIVLASELGFNWIYIAGAVARALKTLIKLKSSDFNQDGEQDLFISNE